MGATIDQKSIKKRPPRWDASWHRFLKRFWSIFGTKLGWKIDQKSIKNGIEKTIGKRWAAWAPEVAKNSISGGATYSDPTRRGCGADATRTRRAENPLPAAAKAAALRAKIQVKINKETIPRIQTRLGPVARRINPFLCFSSYSSDRDHKL